MTVGLGGGMCSVECLLVQWSIVLFKDSKQLQLKCKTLLRLIAATFR